VTRLPRRAAVALVVAMVATIAATIAGCSRPGDSGYHLSVEFPRAVALYSQSRVKVMGIDVGVVRSIEVDGDHVRVEMTIDDDVPLPADVEASIVPLSLVGERNIILSPAWQPGDARAKDGDVIPSERTHVPVEPDEALKAVTDLAHAIDPAALAQLVSGGAAALDGHGRDLHDALAGTGDLVALLASQDQTLLSLASNLHALASMLNAREAQLGKLLDDFAAATDVLAEERDAIASFLRALVDLTNQGKALLTQYEVQLPQDLDSLASLTMTIAANADSVQQLVNALSQIADGFVAAYEPQTGGIRVRLSGGPTMLGVVQSIFDLFGLGPAPCVPAGYACE